MNMIRKAMNDAGFSHLQLQTRSKGESRTIGFGNPSVGYQALALRSSDNINDPVVIRLAVEICAELCA